MYLLGEVGFSVVRSIAVAVDKIETSKHRFSDHGIRECVNRQITQVASYNISTHRVTAHRNDYT